MLSHFTKTFDVTPFVMEALCTLSTHFVPQITFNSAKFRTFCTSSIALSVTHQVINGGKSCKKSVLKKSSKAKARVSDTQLKENWLESLSCSSQEKVEECKSKDGGGVEWVIGVDPDVSGALALLKSDGSGCSAQVFDSPYLQVLVGKKARRRLDAKSIVQLVRSFGAPLGTAAYIEQSLPFPQDGKQGWWGGGFGYGMWIGILVASGFSVVPVPSFTWKKHFELSGSHLSKDDSRKAACTLFPSLCSQLTRKKDHGRAEALLIAAFGKGLQLKCDSSTIEECENGVADEIYLEGWFQRFSASMKFVGI